jgi:membrane protein implicated in regulation of membrane protease activity
MVPGFVIFFFGSGALLTGLLSWLIPGLSGNFLAQILIWLGSSALSLGFLRKRLSSIFTGTLLSGSDGKQIESDEDSGLTAQVVQKITPEKSGRISLHGTTWTAKSFDEQFEPGETVAILKKEGMSYWVTRSIV